MKPWQMMQRFGQLASGGGATDPDWANRSAVLNFSGSYAAGGAYVEPKGRSVTIQTGATEGGGVLTCNGDGGRVSLSNDGKLDFGTGDFLIEVLVNFATIVGETYQTLYAHGYTSAGHVLVQSGNADGKFTVYLGGSVICTESTAASAGVDYWYEISRSGTTVRIKRNGTTTASGTSSANLSGPGFADIGGTPGGGGTHGVNGVIRAARISKGISSSTLPPSDPLPES